MQDSACADSIKIKVTVPHIDLYVGEPDIPDGWHQTKKEIEVEIPRDEIRRIMQVVCEDMRRGAL